MAALPDLLKSFFSNAVGVFQGVMAFIVQSYTEVNVKRGLQYAAATRTTIPAGGSVAILFRTTTKQAIVKAREINFAGLELYSYTLRDATFTEGADLDIYNQNDVTEVPTTVVLKQVTAVSGGTTVFTPRHFIGVESTNQTPTPPRPSTTGLENIMRANTDYVIVVENLDTNNPAEVEIYGTWYEGGTDYPME